MTWDLFEYQPRKCFHPELEGRWFPVIVCQAGEGNVMIFDLNFIVNASVSGIPGSGHPYIPKNDVQLGFDAESNDWVMVESGEDPRTYRFGAPDQNLLRWFKKYQKKHIPSHKAMQDKTDKMFD